ncbi:MAG: flagellar export chaperone FliS [Aeromonas sobria]
MFANDNPLTAYRQGAIHARIASASPQELVVMMIEHLLEELDRVEGHLAAMRLDKKGDGISKCLEILHALDSSLQMEAGGELAEQLHQLYDYCSRRLLEVNLRNQAAPLAEVRMVLQPIKEGWEGARG